MSQQKFYAGIGSRKTPEDVLVLMTRFAKKMEEQNFILRTGGAEGADSAFMAGVENPENLHVFLPWKTFNGGQGIFISDYEPWCRKAQEEVSKVHPAWNRLTQGAKKLHTRNFFQIFGMEGQPQSSFVLFWAEEDLDGVKGGTATAVNLAIKFGIKTFNLKNKETRRRIEVFLQEP